MCTTCSPSGRVLRGGLVSGSAPPPAGSDHLCILSKHTAVPAAEFRAPCVTFHRFSSRNIFQGSVFSSAPGPNSHHVPALSKSTITPLVQEYFSEELFSSAPGPTSHHVRQDPWLPKQTLTAKLNLGRPAQKEVSPSLCSTCQAGSPCVWWVRWQDGSPRREGT